MSDHRLSPEQHRARRDARWAIVQAVNRHKLRSHTRHRYTPALFDLRHIQRAVRIARHHRLVTPQVLTAAGFRA